MRLTECYIESFGKLKNKTIRFTEGMNSFIGDNGEGKTTLTVFIKAMLYGIGDTKKSSIEENDRKHYLPWDGSRAGGTLTFSAGGNKYRIERTFGKRAADDTFAVYDVALGRLADDFGEELGVKLFGIDAKGFEQTVFLSERNLTPESDATSITEKLSELVGTDGGAGVIDEALSVLDNQRKFYRKKGGGGQIADTRVELSRIEGQLEEIDQAEARLEENEKKLKDNLACQDSLSEAKIALSSRREALSVKRATEGYERKVASLRAELEHDISEKEELINFFAQGVPSYQELDNISDKRRELERIRQSGQTSPDEAEYVGLRDYFLGRVTEEDAITAREAVRAADAESQRVPSPEERRANEAFVGRVPESEKIKRLGQLADRRISSAAGVVLTALGCVGALALGCVGYLVDSIFYAGCAVGAVMAVGGIIALISATIRRRRLEQEIREAIIALPASELYIKMPPRVAAMELCGLYPLLPRGGASYMDKILGFLERFDIRECANPLSFVREVLNKYDRFRLLHAGREFRTDASEATQRRKEELEREISDFLACYNTESSDPIAEIREKLTRYSRLTDSIRSRRQDIESLSELSATRAPSTERDDTAESIEAESWEIEQKLTSLQGEATIISRQISLDTAALDERSSLLAEKERALEALGEYEKNYETIVRTADFLKKASESVTSRYLGKTREGFAKYTAMISGDSTGVYEMDTGFSVAKREGAHSYPTESYSRGMRDLYRLSARLALVDSLYESESPFIILDDPFASFDDGKVKAALSLIERLAKDRQILYFTCSRSRALDKSKKI